jgi:hypothetical protein
MSKLSKIMAIVGVVAAVAAIGMAIGFWGSRGGPIPATSSVESNHPGFAVSHPNPTPAPGPAANISPKVPRHHVRTDTTITTNSQGETVTTPSASANTNIMADWEEKVDDLLTAEEEEPAKAKKMLELFPKLPEDGQIEVAQHLSNLVPDENYGDLAKLLKDAKLSDGVLDVLFGDALNRPNSLKLPVLLEVARDPQNPKAEEAKDVLQLFMEEDYGDDWGRWQARMDSWLKENPD